MEKKRQNESENDLESQFEEKDAANGQDMSPEQNSDALDHDSAGESGASAEGEDAAQGQQGTPADMLSEMVEALEVAMGAFHGKDQKLVSQALLLLSQVGGVKKPGDDSEDGMPSAEEGEDLTNKKGGLPVGPQAQQASIV